MDGMQRLLLPDEATTLIVQTLLADQSVQVFLGSFSTLLCPANFPYQYAKFIVG